MPAIQDLPRQVVPRWRLFRETLQNGELSPLKIGPKRFTEDHVAGELFDWKQSPTLSVAADLVSVAFALGLETIAIDAAQFVLDSNSAPPAARGVAVSYLREAGIDVSELEASRLVLPSSPTTGSARLLLPSDRTHIIEIHRIRENLSEYPRNAIEWCNLALLYTFLGVLDKAERAMRNALSLAPANRFVLRAGARFFLHIGQRDRARSILARSPSVKTDPWILAAEIATSDAMRQTSSFMRQAKSLIESRKYSDYHLSELASAVGTVEYKAGKVRAGRQIIERSLVDPSENAVAQAAWLARQLNANIRLPPQECSPEASAWTDWENGHWADSLEQANKWLEDQQFSSRPASFGSFIQATVFENFDETKRFAEIGLRSNPGDRMLLNNYAFACAKQGDVDTAMRLIKGLVGEDLNDVERIVFSATFGAIAFRSGVPEMGRQLYQQAIHLARVKKNDVLEAQAYAHLAVEELRIESEGAPETYRHALKLANDLHSQMGTVLRELLERHEYDGASAIRRSADGITPDGH